MLKESTIDKVAGLFVWWYHIWSGKRCIAISFIDAPGFHFFTWGAVGPCLEASKIVSYEGCGWTGEGGGVALKKVVKGRRVQRSCFTIHPYGYSHFATLLASLYYIVPWSLYMPRYICLVVRGCKFSSVSSHHSKCVKFFFVSKWEYIHNLTSIHSTFSPCLFTSSGWTCSLCWRSW